MEAIRQTIPVDSLKSHFLFAPLLFHKEFGLFSLIEKAGENLYNRSLELLYGELLPIVSLVLVIGALLAFAHGHLFLSLANLLCVLLLESYSRQKRLSESLKESVSSLEDIGRAYQAQLNLHSSLILRATGQSKDFEGYLESLKTEISKLSQHVLTLGGLVGKSSMRYTQGA